MIKSLTAFILIFVLAAGCHSKTDKQIFDSAGEKAKTKNFTEAIKEYDMLADEYPASDLTCKGLLETAKIYHGLLIPNMQKEESFKKAITYYEKIISEFGNRPEAESSLFAIGFIQANELKQFDSAKMTYESFLKKYPKSEFANSVQLELNNLGKTPEEILQNSTAKK